MKLYYFPGACSLAVHIALREAGLSFELDRVHVKTRQTESGKDFKSINSKGYVPVLELDDGHILTEAAAILHYVADQAPAGELLPEAGTMAYYDALSWLNYIATEVHKSYGPLFDKSVSGDARAAAVKKLESRFDWLVEQIGEKDFLQENYSVADMYLSTVLTWQKWVKLDMSPWPTLTAYVERIEQREAVQAARAAEAS